MHSSTCMDLRVQCRVIARTLGSKSRSFNHAEDDRNCASAVHVQQCAGQIGSQGSLPAARAQRSSLPLLIGICGEALRLPPRPRRLTKPLVNSLEKRQRGGR